MTERIRSGLVVGAVFFLLLVPVLGGCGKDGDDIAGPEYTVQVVLAGSGGGRVWSPYGGIDCPTVCGPVDWTGGGTAPFNASPDSVSKFVSWSGAATGTDTTCDVVITGHMILTATFDLK